MKKLIVTTVILVSGAFADIDYIEVMDQPDPRTTTQKRKTIKWGSAKSWCKRANAMNGSNITYCMKMVYGVKVYYRLKKIHES